MKNKLVSLFLVALNTMAWCENQINDHPQMTEYVIKNNILGKDDFFLIDVGASGGIASYWKALGKHLCGVGFDPLIEECKRLNSHNPFPRFNYVPSYIIAESSEADQYKNENKALMRSSSRFYMKRYSIDYEKQYFNNGNECILSETKTSLDRYCSENNIKKVDFIKVDTDGTDFAVLLGAKKLLGDDQLLGVYIEINFHGENHPAANTFRNIDSLLSSNGFDLYDLSTWRYTKAELPGTFLYKLPAQTTTGQTTWGDALYLRDFVALKRLGKEIPTSQLIKMACIQEIFGLPDCAAEILVNFRDQLSKVVDVDKCLNGLTRDMKLHPDYKAHISQFNTNSTAFYPK